VPRRTAVIGLPCTDVPNSRVSRTGGKAVEDNVCVGSVVGGNVLGASVVAGCVTVVDGGDVGGTLVAIAVDGVEVVVGTAEEGDDGADGDDSIVDGLDAIASG
jgi:hypothetical protein